MLRTLIFPSYKKYDCSILWSQLTCNCKWN